MSAPPGGTGTRGTAPQPRPENVTASGTSGLQALQLEIQRYVLRADELAVDRVHDGVRATAGECLGIYAEAYRLRFLGVLRADYPALRALLGDDAFDALARDYIEDHPSRHFSVRHFGTDLADHLARHPRCRDRAYLSELAALEWTLGEAFDAADRQPLDQADLAAIPPVDWGEMCLELHPSVNRLDLRWNAPALRQSFNEGEPMPPPAAAPDAVPWLVWRNGLETYFRSLSPDEAWALDAARRGLSFGDICDGLCEWIDEERAALRGAGLLHRWVTDGMVTGAGGAP